MQRPVGVAGETVDPNTYRLARISLCRQSRTKNGNERYREGANCAADSEHKTPWFDGRDSEYGVNLEA